MRQLLVGLVFALGLSAACVPPASIQTPAGSVAYTADQIVTRVNELQNAAIQANAAGALPQATTRLIVQFAVAADTTLATTPLGWQQTIQTAWKAVKAQLPANLNTNVGVAVGVVDALLQTLGSVA